MIIGEQCRVCEHDYLHYEEEMECSQWNVCECNGDRERMQREHVVSSCKKRERLLLHLTPDETVDEEEAAECDEIFKEDWDDGENRITWCAEKCWKQFAERENIPEQKAKAPVCECFLETTDTLMTAQLGELSRMPLYNIAADNYDERVDCLEEQWADHIIVERRIGL